MSNTIPITINIPVEMLAEALAMNAQVDRHAAMVDRLGEACSKTAAARAIDSSRMTIDNMLKDGRIKYACEGTRVDVRSLADYIERRKEIDHDTRLRKKYKSGLHV